MSKFNLRDTLSFMDNECTKVKLRNKLISCPVTVFGHEPRISMWRLHIYQC